MMITIVREARVRPEHFADDEPDIVYPVGSNWPYWPEFFWLLEQGYGVEYYV